MKKILRILVLLILIGFVFGVIYFVVKSVKVQNITCESQYGECYSALASSISNISHNNIFETRNNLINLLRSDKSILDYSVNFKLPLNFSVNVIEKKAIAAFILTDGQFALVDKDGNLLYKVKKTSLPKVSSAIALDRDKIMYIANLMAEIYTFYKVDSGKVTADGIEVDNINGKKILFPLDGDQDKLLGALILIISRLPSVKEASTISTIDLRFKNPVLR